jgi:type IV secretory pathway protease TraF
VSCGLYLVKSSPPVIGDYVLFQPDAILTTRINSKMFLIKKLAFNNRENYSIDNTCIRVADLTLYKIKPVGLMTIGQLMNNECLVFGTNKYSYDSRYFGAVKYSSLVKVVPILIWDNRGTTYE